MSEKSNRKNERVSADVTCFVRKILPDGGYSLMQFVNKDLSEGGIFLVTDDLSLFDMNEDLTILVERGRERYFEGSARVVRSARIFTEEDEMTESGFGLMFVNTDEIFASMVRETISSASTPD